MRIAYLTEWSPYAKSGVLRKIIAQVSTWRKLGCEASAFALSPYQKQAPAFDYAQIGRVYGVVPQRFLDAYPFARLGYINKIATIRSLYRALVDYKPDIIYYRHQRPWYPGVLRLLGLAPTVMEINANQAEAEHWGAALGYLTRLTQGRILQSVDGFVCVSNTIAAEYSDLAKPIAVVPNAMWAPCNPLPPTNNTSPSFVFVGSRLTGSRSWHGTDKIFTLAERIPNSKFNVVGLGVDDLGWPRIPANAVIHEEVYGPALEHIYQESDIGIGTLALHRRKLGETSALKTLEYLMYGLPIILGYNETHERLRSAPYLLNIGNHEQNVVDRLEEIIEFSMLWCGKRVKDDLSYLSSAVLETQRLSFLKAVSSNSATEFAAQLYHTLIRS